MSMFASLEAVLYPVVCQINEYLSKQKRFNRVTDEIRARIIAEAKNRYETLQRLSELDCV